MTTEAVSMSVTTREAPTGVCVTVAITYRMMASAAHIHLLVSKILNILAYATMFVYGTRGSVLLFIITEYLSIRLNAVLITEVKV